jgi:hypothetical protein
MPDIDMNARYIPSQDVVAREIEGELIIIPLVAGIGDIDDELFSLNESGKVVWDQLNGKSSLDELVQSLADHYAVPQEEMDKDVRGFIGELLKRKLIIDARTARTSS